MLWRMARETTGVKFPGLYVGEVVKVEDLGRVQVIVPAIFDRTTPESFVWARPCFPYGHFFVPEVGDKVWVAFEHGDPTAPVWLGIWYLTGAVPAEANVSPPVKRVIRSAKGHVVIMDDTGGSEKLILQDKSGNRIELRGDGVLIKCAQNLTIDASGKDIVIKASSVDIQQA
jgi:uncharacterized protein involved in type VI secretion and phage assembly